MYTLIVGTQDWSSWSLRPYLALMATGAPFDMEVIRLRVTNTSRETILKYSPAGKVPVLKYDGRRCGTVWRSARPWRNGIPKHNCGRRMPRCGRGRGPMPAKCIPAFPISATS
jgi:hypothetical protein